MERWWEKENRKIETETLYNIIIKIITINKKVIRGTRFFTEKSPTTKRGNKRVKIIDSNKSKSLK